MKAILNRLKITKLILIISIYSVGWLVWSGPWVGRWGVGWSVGRSVGLLVIFNSSKTTNHRVVMTGLILKLI